MSPDVSSRTAVPPEESLFAWLLVSRTGVEQSFGSPSRSWLHDVRASENPTIVCLEPYLFREFRDEIVNFVASPGFDASTFHFLIARRPLPRLGSRIDPPVHSYACSLQAYLALCPHAMHSAGVLAYQMAERLLETEGAVHPVRCVQFPFGQREHSTSTGNMDAEWIIPHQGDLGYLDKCLQSVALTATRGDQVSVCLDEPLTNMHRVLMNRYAQYRFYAVSHPNVGPYVGRDRLGRGSGASVVYFQDSDDLSSVDRRPRLEAAMTQRGLDLVGSHELRVDLIQKAVLPVRFPADVSASAMHPVYRHPFFHPTSAIRSDALRRAGGFSTHRRFGNDTEFLFRAMFFLKIGNVDDFLYIRRKRPNSLSTTPGIELGSPVRRQMSVDWAQDFGQVATGQLSIYQSSFRLQHRDDYDAITVNLLER